MNKLRPIVICILLLVRLDVAFSQETILRLNKNATYEMFFIDTSIRVDEVNSIDTKKDFTVKWDTLRSFFVDQQKDIRQLDQLWIGQSTDEIYFCDYDYYIYLFEDGKFIDCLRVNTECKQVVTKHGTYNYQGSPLEILPNNKKLAVATIDFGAISIARKMFGEASSNGDIFIPHTKNNEWLNFDGRISISSAGGDENSVKQNIERSIKESFPNENFKVECWASDSLFSLSYIYCQKALAEKLTGFKISRPWKPLEARMQLISSKKSSIKRLVLKYSY